MSYYHSNPAVIKSQLSQLSQQAFIQQALIIRSTLFQLPFSSSSKSHYQRFLNLYLWYRDWETDRKSTRLNSSHITRSRMPSSA